MKYFLLFYIAFGAVGALSFVVGVFDKKRRRGWFWVAAFCSGLFAFQAAFVLWAVQILMNYV